MLFQKSRNGIAFAGRRMFVMTLLVGLCLLPGVASAGKIVIGHRGACGYLPEHTLESYAYAHALGADYIEPDLVMTKDHHFICLHDIHLDSTTNVKQVFPDRHRADGHYYAADFTLTEIKQMRAHERLEHRFPQNDTSFEIPTFEEMIELVQGLNKTTGRNAGIYPELKDPSWHRAQGLPMEQAFMDIVTKYGYKGKDAKIYVQCFEADSLKRLRNECNCDLPLILLMNGGHADREMATEKGMAEIAKFANGIGPSKTFIEHDPQLVKFAHDNGLVVHPYTFRADDVPPKYANVQEEMKTFYFTYDVDGLFTDFPDIARAVLKAKK